MSMNHSERSLKPSEFTKGGGDAGFEQPGNSSFVQGYTPVLRNPVRPHKSKSVFGQYQPLSQKPELAKGTPTSVRFHSTTTPRKVKKATSMEDLTPERRKMVDLSRVMRTMSLTPATMGDEPDRVDPQATKQLLASRRIFQVLMLNAWRKLKSNVAVLIAERDQLSREVGNHTLQVALLKSLLESEKERSNKSVAQLQEVTVMMEEVTEELHIVRKDKEEVYTKLACQDLRQADVEAKLDRANRELQVVNRENCELTGRLHSSDEEVSSLRDENTHLHGQAASQNESLASQAEQIKGLQVAKQDLDERLSVQMTALLGARQEAEDAVRSVARLEEELARKNGDLNAVEMLNAELLEKIRSLLREMQERSSEMENLKARLQENELEMKNRSWSHQLRTVASLMAYIITRVVTLTMN